MELDNSFGNKKLKTNVYIKMDAYDQLLLSEGICRQLGIITYHPIVHPFRQRQVEGSRESNTSKDHCVVGNDDKGDIVVPLVRMQLVQGVKLLPQQGIKVQVQAQGECTTGKTFVVEPDPCMAELGSSMEPLVTELKHGTAQVFILNLTGFTQRLEQGLKLRTLEEGEIISSTINTQLDPEQATSDDQLKECIVVNSITSESWRMDKVREMFYDNLHLSKPERLKFCQFLMDHHEVFSLQEEEWGDTQLIQIKIDTGNAQPKRQHPRRLPFVSKQEVARQIQTMLDAGVIQPSVSPWVSPIVLVQKKDGTYRFCVDYWELNTVTKPNKFPLPRIDDLLDELENAKFFSTLDLTSGFWQVQVHPDSRAKTAFIAPQGLHEFRVMPFGLTNASSVFQHLMQKVLMGLNPPDASGFVTVYIDDILVYSETLEQHLEHLRTVMGKLIQAGLKLKPSKCLFVRDEVRYLGHVITPRGLKTSNQHIIAVQEFTNPKSVKDVRQFLGLSSFYRKFVPSFAKIAGPLHTLTRKNAPFNWTEQLDRRVPKSIQSLEAEVD